MENKLVPSSDAVLGFLCDTAERTWNWALMLGGFFFL